ncbi:MAG: hypothetical protein H7099_08375 [Gemmatimonadaceae bacterium]|nr:hypothetical protein [Gemmatimonadaceae bacterium]
MSIFLRTCSLLVMLMSGAAGIVSAQSTATDTSKTTGGLSVGVSGLRSNDGTTIVGDLMWVGAEMNDGIGLRLLRQGLAPRAHGYAAMIVIGGPPRDSLHWMRIDFGLGYVGQQSDRSLKFYQRHGLGAQFALTIAPVKLGIVRPELNGWAVVGTSARFLGASLGVRVLDPRQR